MSWMRNHQDAHEIQLCRKKSELEGGDLLFLISCNQIVSADDRKQFTKSLVIHASNLPEGRGWSPHIWQLLEGKREVIVSLLEAEDKVDSGAIWRQVKLEIPDHALWNEINERLFTTEGALMDFAVDHFGEVIPLKQDEATKPTYYEKRRPADSEIDPEHSLSEQFDLIRVCDPERFPAFFKLRGHTYTIRLEKIDARSED